jgi:2-polyprenyl-6-methoxyphenol hydroxylase-like FAD-dependent oxidoreductase
MRALRSLELEDAVRGCTHALREARTMTPDGRVITKVPLKTIEEQFGPLVSVHRGELLMALRDSFRGEIEYGTTVQAQGGRLYANGAPVEADLVVGADGIGSVTRRLVASDVRVRPAGYGAWRGISASGAVRPLAATETMGRGKRFGLVPLTSGRTYWFAVVSSGGENADLEREFAGWHEPITAVLEATPLADRSYLELADIPRLRRWHRSQIVLVGDAAHAMTPNLGQGAAQALQDIATLAERLRTDPLESALAGYADARKRRCERVVARSRAVGRLAQASNPVVVKARDALARVVPDRVVVRQFAGILAD